MSHRPEIEAFDLLLASATKLIAEEYFLHRVAGRTGSGDSPVQYRERVYAYELYHRLRCGWPNELDEYTLGGEIDKRSHPIFDHTPEKGTKPDLLVHKPGTMDFNLVIVEIKVLGPSFDLNAAQKDITKLSGFCGEPAQYQKGILLFFGPERNGLPALVKVASDLRNIELWHHAEPGLAAHRMT